MTSKWFKQLPALAAFAGALLSCSGWAAQAQTDQRECNRNSLLGTWRVQVTLHKCGAAPHAQPFWSLLSFGPAGTVIETTANPAFQPGQRSTGFGVWKKNSDDTYHVISEAFILFDSEAHPPVPAFVRGRQRITQEIKMKNEDEFTSSATVEFLDESGNVVMSGCASATGYRME